MAVARAIPAARVLAVRRGGPATGRSTTGRPVVRGTVVRARVENSIAPTGRTRSPARPPPSPPSAIHRGNRRPATTLSAMRSTSPRGAATSAPGLRRARHRHMRPPKSSRLRRSWQWKSWCSPPLPTTAVSRSASPTTALSPTSGR